MVYHDACTGNVYLRNSIPKLANYEYQYWGVKKYFRVEMIGILSHLHTYYQNRHHYCLNRHAFG